jgi:hypothetical protein
MLKGQPAMTEIRKSDRRIGDETDRFDTEFWQAQADQAIFEAALDMVRDDLTKRQRRDWLSPSHRRRM